MRVLLLHPEDFPQRGPWSAQRWDLIVDLGRSSPASAAAWEEATHISCAAHGFFPEGCGRHQAGQAVVFAGSGPPSRRRGNRLVGSYIPLDRARSRSRSGYPSHDFGNRRDCGDLGDAHRVAVERGIRSVETPSAEFFSGTLSPHQHACPALRKRVPAVFRWTNQRDVFWTNTIPEYKLAVEICFPGRAVTGTFDPATQRLWERLANGCGLCQTAAGTIFSAGRNPPERPAECPAAECSDAGPGELTLEATFRPERMPASSNSG